MTGRARLEGGDAQSLADRAFTVTADAYTSAPGTWAEAIHAALARLFDYLAGEPASMRACIDATLAGGKPALARRDRMLARFAEFLEPGYAQASVPPPPVVSEAISGGIYELIRTHAVERRIESLPDALPDATLIVLAPFVGAEEAERLAAAGPVGARMDA